MQKSLPDVDEEANDKANNTVDGQTEAFARALDTVGWMIVRQCYGHDEVGSKWMLEPENRAPFRNKQPLANTRGKCKSSMATERWIRCERVDH